MATRFYLNSVDEPAVSPPFSALWEQTGEAVRRVLDFRTQLAAFTPLTDLTCTVPAGVAQDVLCAQFVSRPVNAHLSQGPINANANNSLVVLCAESAVGVDTQLAALVRAVSVDGGTERGTLYSNFSISTEFGTTAATRIVNASGLTQVALEIGDRIVLEIGGHVAATATAGSFTLRVGTDTTADFAVTTDLTTDLRPFLEFNYNINALGAVNYQAVKVYGGDGMSVGERVR